MNRLGVSWLVTPLIMVTLLVSGCASWVELTPEGQQITLATPEQVTECKRLGRTLAQSKANIGMLDRDSETVAQELEFLARNSAAEMGGNTIVAQPSEQPGKQHFLVYDCR